MNTTQVFKKYSTEDKAALRELKSELEEERGEEVKLADMIKLVEPEEARA